MYCNRLLQSINDHWEEIARGVIRRIRNERDAPNMQKLSDREFESWAHGILEALLSKALAGADESGAVEYQALGRLRFETSVNLYEVVRCLHLLKLTIIEFARNRGFAQNAIELYAQEEFEHYVGFFFDWVLYNVVRGYEKAQQHAANQPGGISPGFRGEREAR